MESRRQGLTIGSLARSAGVGIETIRYYQRRLLLPVPVVSTGSIRRYPLELVERIRFIKRAQELGFSLDQILDLLALEGGDDRAAIRRLAADRKADVHAKIKDLERMEFALSSLIHECETTDGLGPCPIIATLAGAAAKPSGVWIVAGSSSADAPKRNRTRKPARATRIASGGQRSREPGEDPD